MGTPLASGKVTLLREGRSEKEVSRMATALYRPSPSVGIATSWQTHPPYRGEEPLPPTEEVQAIFATTAGLEEDLLAEIEASVHIQETSSLRPAPNESQRGLALAALKELTHILTLPEQEKRTTISRVYKTLLGVYCSSALGQVFPLPGGEDGIWEKRIGKLLYAAFAVAYGDDLLLNKQVEEATGKDLSRIGQLQRLGLLQFIENPWVAHQKQRRRRVSIDMLQEFLAAEQAEKAKRTPKQRPTLTTAKRSSRRSKKAVPSEITVVSDEGTTTINDVRASQNLEPVPVTLATTMA